VNHLVALARFTALLAATYYVTTFCLWFSHWLGHTRWSPLRNCHLLGHHRIYPDSRRCRSGGFICSRGKHDSIRTMVPWLVLAAGGGFLVLPLAWAVCGALQVAGWAGFFAWLHVQFHLDRSVLRRFGWFGVAGFRHDLHHDLDSNFMVGDHFWDRLTGTFREAPPIRRDLLTTGFPSQDTANPAANHIQTSQRGLPPSPSARSKTDC
jgi:hypothetical protein